MRGREGDEEKRSEGKGNGRRGKGNAERLGI